MRNDISKNKLVYADNVIFFAAAAMLVSLAAILIVNLFGALDTLMTQVKKPHFMQMHSDAVNSARHKAFAENNSYVDAFQQDKLFVIAPHMNQNYNS